MDGSAGLERLLAAVQELSMAEELETVQRIVRTAARALADGDGATFVLRDGDHCYYADEDAISPLWRGSRFPMDACVSGVAMRERVHVTIPDIYVDARVPHDAYRSTFVKSMAMFPVRTLDPIAAIGVYWAAHREPSDQELSLLQSLANATSIALEKVRVHEELARIVQLRLDADRRSVTDELTGLLNRRGFTEQSRLAWQEAGTSFAAVAFIDLDGLKEINDKLGHDAGDRHLRLAADRICSASRAGDVCARLGGDEFALFCPGLESAALAERLRPLLDGVASLGTASLSTIDHLPDALLVADSRMYAAKRDRARASVG